MNVLHIIPRFIGGGPERHLLALADAWQTAGLQTRQRILVLDPPASAPLLIRARRLGISLLIAPDLAAIRKAIAGFFLIGIGFVCLGLIWCFGAADRVLTADQLLTNC